MTSIGLLFLFLVLRIIDAQNGCADRRANCINIRRCPSLIEILSGPIPLSHEKLKTFRDSLCGFEGNVPMVCCINQETPTMQTLMQPTGDVPDPPNVSNHPNLHLLNFQLCGPFTEKKIFGGNSTSIIEYPWMALIEYDTGRGTDFYCGGTIISQRYILTAAHCVTTLPEDLTLIGVRVGDHDINKERDCDINENGLEIQCAERYQDFGIESVHFHPQYTRSKLQNDIALIRLNGTMDFRPRSVRPVCLPIDSARTINQKALVVTGWGATELGPRSQSLLQARLPLMSNEECAEVYKNIAQISYKQLCAGGLDMIESCMGDSGGSLQVPTLYSAPNVRNKLRVVQYGVVSYGGLKQCGTAGFPGVYTRLHYYMDWILNTMRE